MEQQADSETGAMARRCIALRERLQAEALRLLPRERVAAEAKAIGLPVEEALAQIAEDELRLAYDLALHGAPPGRPRPMDRLGTRLRGGVGDEAAMVLRGLQAAWFSVFRVIGSHAEAGLLVEDALLGGEAWIVDDALVEHEGAGTLLAARLARVQGFAITCGMALPLDEPSFEEIRAILDGAGVPPVEMTADVRFLRLIYRRAIGLG